MKSKIEIKTAPQLSGEILYKIYVDGDYVRGYYDLEEAKRIASNIGRNLREFGQVYKPEQIIIRYE